MADYIWDEEIRPTDPHLKGELEDRSSYTYGGEIQLDKNITSSTPNLYGRLGLDQNRWLIVNIEASLASGKKLTNEHRAGDLIFIYAVDRHKLSEEQNKPGRLFKGTDPIEVVSFKCHDLSFQEILEGMVTTRIDMTLKGMQGRDLIVHGKADIPVQDET